MTAVILDGIVLGLAFGLLGVGMTLVYGLGGVLNLAYGQIVVLAAIVASIVMDDGRATLVAAVLGVLAAAGVGVLLDLTLMRPVYRERGEERTLLGLLLTLGAAFVIGGVLTWRYPDGALYIYISGRSDLDPRRADDEGKHLGLGDRAGGRSLAPPVLRRHHLRPRRPLGDPGRGGRAARRDQPVVRPHGHLRAERRAGRDRGDHALDERAVDGERRASSSPRSR